MERNDKELVQIETNDRRNFIKQAGAAAFVAPVVVSYLVTDLVKSARAQEAYARFTLGSSRRITEASDGVITDNQTGLEWYVWSSENVYWDQASAWVHHLSVDGGGWSLPTIAQLQGIYLPGLDSTFGIRYEPLVWSGDSCVAGSMGGYWAGSHAFAFYNGRAYCVAHNNGFYYYQFCAFAVRRPS